MRQRFVFFFNYTATAEIYTLSLHDALPIYGRNVIDAIVRSPEASTFIPALAYLYARNPVEIEVAHEARASGTTKRSEEHTSELQSRQYLVCRLLLEKKKIQLLYLTTHDHVF